MWNRAHGESIVNDDEEQLGTRARISNLIAGLRGDGRPDGTLRLIRGRKW